MQLRIDHEPRFLSPTEGARVERSPAALVRMSYALATARCTTPEFLERLALAAHPVLGRDRGLVGCWLGLEADVCRVERAAFVGCAPGTYEALCSATLATSAADAQSALFGGATAGLVSERLAPTSAEYLARRELTHLARAGIVDHLFLRLDLGNSGGQQAVFLFVPLAELGSLKARERAALNELAVELSGAFRLHLALRGEPARAEEEPCSSRIMKLCRSERAKRADPDQALELWRALLDGRWSLLAQTNAQGKRVLLLRRTDSGSSSWPRLTEHEKHAARSVLMGHSNKTISIELGISPAATTAFVGSAIRKLGLRSRAELSGAFRAARATLQP
jgi:DNA-binding CsgD family transcriptional regulator